MNTIDDIPTHWDAAYKSYEVTDIARYLGAVYYQEYWTPAIHYPLGNNHIFTHFFNADGLEVLVCCNAMNNTIQILDPPRKWGVGSVAACNSRVYI